MKISKIQKERLFDYLKQGKRFDGRKLNEYRKIIITKDISNKAEGSASVKIGNTEVYAGVKLDVMEPYPDSQDEGCLITTFEFSPIASPDFEAGPPQIESIEQGRIIDRGIRESKLINLKKLCIKEGEKVWAVYLDIYSINDGGNLLDCAALAALTALANTKLPSYNEKDGKVEHDRGGEDLPLNKDAMAFNITFHKLGSEIILDPSKEEEEASEFRVSFAVAPVKTNLKITAIQKGNECAIAQEELEKILKMIEDIWKQVFSKISKEIWD